MRERGLYLELESERVSSITFPLFFTFLVLSYDIS